MADTAGLPVIGLDDALQPGPAVRFRHSVFGHGALMIGLLLLATIVTLALLAPWIAPIDPYAQDLANRLRKPFWIAGDWRYPLGTDDLGRDMVSRLLHGARISLLIGFSAMLISGIIGTLLGLAGGYFRGRVDTAVTFLITTRLSMPIVLVALAVVSLVGSSLTVIVLVLGFLLWDRFAVVIRAATLQVGTQEFVLAARVSGASHWRILLREILPNIAGPLIVVATLEMAHAILLEAALSFLGLGVQPPLPSWGLMIADGKKHLLFNSWMINIPGVAIFLLVLAINLIGDGFRDITGAGRR